MQGLSQTGMKQVGIIGGGIAGLICAQQLAKNNISPVVFDMGRTVGRFCNFPGDESVFVGYPSMQSVCNWLAETAGIEVRQGKVDKASFDGQWTLTTMDKKLDSKVEQTHGPFDAIVFTDKLNARAESVGYVKILDDALSQLYSQMLSAQSEGVFSSMFAFKKGQAGELDQLKIDALAVQNSDYFQWICRDSSKPGRGGGDYDCWIAITTPKFATKLSKQNPWVPRGGPKREQYLRQQSEAALQQLKISLRLENGQQPFYQSTQRWASGFQLPAKNIPNFLYQSDLKAVACGDFCSGSRIDLILSSAIDASKFIRNSLLSRYQ